MRRDSRSSRKNKALYPYLSAENLLQISIVTLSILSCLFIFPKNVFAGIVAKGPDGTTQERITASVVPAAPAVPAPGAASLIPRGGFAGPGGNGNILRGGIGAGVVNADSRGIRLLNGPLPGAGGNIPVEAAAVVRPIAATATPTTLQALGRTAMTTVQPAIQRGQAAYNAGRAAYNAASPTLTTAYQEFGRMASRAPTPTTPATVPARPPVAARPRATPARLAPPEFRPAEPVLAFRPPAPIETPAPFNRQAFESAAPQSLPNNSFAQAPINYNTPSSFRPMPNSNSAFKPIKIDVPPEIGLNNLKYENIPTASLQIKPLPTINPIVNPVFKTLKMQAFNNAVMPKITPINNAMFKPIAIIKPLPMQKLIANTVRAMPTPNLAAAQMPQIRPIDNTLFKPIANLKPLPIQKPIFNTLKPIPTPNFVNSALPKITPINNVMLKPIAGLKPLPTPKPIVNTLKPVPTSSFVKYTSPAITPINMDMIKPIETIKPLTLQNPISDIKLMPAPKFASVDIPSLNYMGKTFGFEVPAYLNRISAPEITPVKMAPLRLPGAVEIPKYAMPQIVMAEIKFQPINKQYVEQTIKVYDAKVMYDASRINSMLSPSNDLQKHFSGRNAIKIDLIKFIENSPGQRKQIINQAQIYANGAQVKKLETLDAWRNEYDKFLALSSNISNVVRETGSIDASSLGYLENVKENLDALTRKITDVGDKAAVQQIIKSPGETVINPLMKEVPMPSALENPSLKVLPASGIAPRLSILDGLTGGVSNLLSSAVHAKEQ